MTKTFKITIGILILLALAAGGVFSVSRKKIQREQKRENIQNAETEIKTNNRINKNGNKYIYNNQELGIEFEYPISWGESKTFIKNSGYESLITITFLNQENLKFYASTPGYSFGNSLIARNQHILIGNKLKDFCEEQKHLGINPREAERSDNGLDVVRFNGNYIYGNCNDNKGVLYAADKKTPSMETDQFMNKDNASVVTNTIDMSKTNYWVLNQSIYRSLNFQYSLPQITSTGFCIHEIPVGDKEHVRVNRCINHKEKSTIENQFNDFNDTALGKEFVNVSESMRISEVINNSYTKRFEQLTKYRHPQISIEISYPSQLKIKETNASVSFGSNDTKYNEPVIYIKMSNKNNIIEETGNYRKLLEEAMGDGPEPPLVSLQLFDKDFEILKSNQEGTIKCPKIDDAATLGYGVQQCETIIIDSRPAIKRYYKASYLSNDLSAIYTLYIGENRVDILKNSPWIYNNAGTIEEYVEQENNDFYLKIAEQMLDSIKFSE